MAWQDGLSLQVRSARHGGVKVIDCKPQQHAISMRKVRIADSAVVMLHIPSVQLKDQPVTRDQSLVLPAAMRTLTAEEALIPTTARLNVAHAN